MVFFFFAGTTWSYCKSVFGHGVDHTAVRIVLQYAVLRPLYFRYSWDSWIRFLRQAFPMDSWIRLFSIWKVIVLFSGET
jgi:hypothetical protein